MTIVSSESNSELNLRAQVITLKKKKKKEKRKKKKKKEKKKNHECIGLGLYLKSYKTEDRHGPYSYLHALNQCWQKIVNHHQNFTKVNNKQSILGLILKYLQK